MWDIWHSPPGMIHTCHTRTRITHTRCSRRTCREGLVKATVLRGCIRIFVEGRTEAVLCVCVCVESTEDEGLARGIHDTHTQGTHDTHDLRTSCAKLFPNPMALAGMFSLPRSSSSSSAACPPSVPVKARRRASSALSCLRSASAPATGGGGGVSTQYACTPPEMHTTTYTHLSFLYTHVRTR